MKLISFVSFKGGAGKTTALMAIASIRSVRTSVYRGGRPGPRLTVLSLGWA